MVDAAGNRQPALDRDWARGLQEKQKKRTAGGQAAALGDDGKIHSAKNFEAIAALADEHCIAIANGGDLLIFARIGLGASTYLHAGAFGCLGVGVPFGIAAALAFPDRQVIPVKGRR